MHILSLLHLCHGAETKENARLKLLEQQMDLVPWSQGSGGEPEPHFQSLIFKAVMVNLCLGPKAVTVTLCLGLKVVAVNLSLIFRASFSRQ